MIYFPAEFRFLLEEMKMLSSFGFLAAGLAIGLVLGRNGISSPRAGDAAAGNASGEVRKTKSGSRDEAELTGVRLIRSAAPDQVGKITRQVLTIPDPVESQRLLSECLLNMTHENWRDIVSSFRKTSNETGRDPADQWKLAVYRSGQIAGQDAVEIYIQNGLKGNTQALWHGLHGWSTKDAPSALRWLRKMEAEGHPIPNDSYTAIIAGSARVDPAAAMRFLDSVPPDKKKDCATHLVWNVIQNSGTDGLDLVLDYASKLDTSDPANTRLAGNLFDKVTEKLLWQGDHARDIGQASVVVERLARYGQDPTTITRRALEKYRSYPVDSKLSFLQTVSAAPHSSELNLPSLSSAVMRTVKSEEDRNAVQQWIAKNPGSPLVPYLENR
ncbi:MAG: hypothetical protein EOP88_21705 [Verrucomicrobiaceae bacterium]|nr:MAG: hypothetical protein EOP88_21705 [Verrucomicrobiaceae bacterium]